MSRRNLVFTLCSLSVLAVGLYFLLVHGPNVEQQGMFAKIEVPGTAYDGSVSDYLREFFSSLGIAGWIKFVLGVLFGVFLYIGVPQLIDRYGGKGWREGE